MTGFVDGPLEPTKVRVMCLFDGVIEKEGCFDRVAEFQRALEAWLRDTGQPVELEYCETSFGDPPDED